MDWTLPILFAGGWASGVLGEYLFHWIMHRRSLRFHLNHHQDFFKLPPREVAVKDLDPRLNIRFFIIALAAVSPLMLWWGWRPVLTFWGGAFWHLVVVYELCHAVMHYDAWLPVLVRERSIYKWWKGCHFEHHRHSPTGNYCVTFPVIDWFLGTYVHPSPEPAPHGVHKPEDCAT